ncbi:MAG: carbohydrate kinase family protein [Oscillospiraceae bacterium]|nr:carbohydrate kinase family protein [Oscillospiraceae bacterium]
MENPYKNIDPAKIGTALMSLTAGAVFGFDGYVDEVWEIVESRSGKDALTKYKQLGRFGELIVGCGTGGVSAEILRKRRTYGGFTANTGNAAAKLGIDTAMIGLFGRDTLDPVFREFESVCAVMSAGDPAVSHIMEFEDGKLIFVYIREIMDAGWATLTAAVPERRLRELLADKDAVALGYWSNMPAFDDILDGIGGLLPEDGRPRRIFTDLADIRKRDAASLCRTMEKLTDLNRRHPVTLSLNAHEAALLCGSYSITFQCEIDAARRCAEALRRVLALDEILVHTPRFAVSAAEDGSAALPQRFCENPVRTTAAGDNFSAGYLAARLAGLNPTERIATANAAAGVFVRRGKPPDKAELINEIKMLNA